MNAITLVSAKLVLGSSLALGLLLTPHAVAHADDAYARENTVQLSEIADEIDSIPTCAMEDGSDVIPAIAGRCLWVNQGNTWLTYEDRSYLVVDDTTVR